VNWKSPLFSKTLWFNILAAAVVVANMFGFVDFKMDAQTQKYADLAVLLINVGLRLVTNKALSLKAQ
jgi:hypothetical protein